MKIYALFKIKKKKAKKAFTINILYINQIFRELYLKDFFKGKKKFSNFEFRIANSFILIYIIILIFNLFIIILNFNDFNFDLI